MIITQEQLSNLTAGQVLKGVVLIKGYSIQLTKTNKEYVYGTIQSGVTVDFKAWDSSEAYRQFKNYEYVNVPAIITASVDTYGGGTSLIIQSVNAVEGYTIDQFLPVKYNKGAYLDATKNLLRSRVSEKGIALLDKLVFSRDDIMEKFQLEFAASTHHDCCKSGLLAHTYKVLGTMNFVLNTYPALNPDHSQDTLDLYYIGTFLHDIGKIVEMNLGVYTDISFVTHRFLGIEFISEHKTYICENYDERWYYMLVSILLQHHGEYEDRCRTLYAKVVHLCDMFDSDFTYMSQLLEAPKEKNGQKTIKLENDYLVI